MFGFLFRKAKHVSSPLFQFRFLSSCGDCSMSSESVQASDSRPPFSLLNHIVGPVMVGPSSSHTAAPYFLASIARELSTSNDESIKNVTIKFEPNGSFERSYRAQGSREGFAAGLLNKKFDDPNFINAFPALCQKGVPFTLSFLSEPLRRKDHPNRTEIEIECIAQNGSQRIDIYEGVSTGGGMFEIDKINGYETSFVGKSHVLVIHCLQSAAEEAMAACMDADFFLLDENNFPKLELSNTKEDELITLIAGIKSPIPKDFMDQLHEILGVELCRQASPTQLAIANDEPLFEGGAAAILKESEMKNQSLARTAERLEALRLGKKIGDVRKLFRERVDILLDSVQKGLDLAAENKKGHSLKHLPFSSATLRENALSASVSGDAIHHASYAALAVMEAAGCWVGPICAAPTSGSAGIIPGCLWSLKESGMSRSELGEILSVMALTGGIISQKATFAAEVAGCAAETGAGSAMAASGICYAYKGSNSQCLDAASICIMNTMGLICDPVGGRVEIPCHAKNIAGVGHAFTASMSVLGGFRGMLPLDETAAKMLEIGLRTDKDFLCTSRGGCATTKTAKRIAKLGWKKATEKEKPQSIIYLGGDSNVHKNKKKKKQSQ